MPTIMGIPWKEYRYFDAKNNCFDLKAMLGDLSEAPRGSVILIQPCAHNPTGYDPTPK